MLTQEIVPTPEILYTANSNFQLPSVHARMKSQATLKLCTYHQSSKQNYTVFPEICHLPIPVPENSNGYASCAEG
jgi:hypothetical protein